jgi:hypothetical protein
MKKQTIRKRISRALRTNRGLRLSEKDVQELDAIVVREPYKNFVTVSAPPDYDSMGRLAALYNNVGNIQRSGMENSHYPLMGLGNAAWSQQTPDKVVTTVEPEQTRSILQAFSMMAEKYKKQASDWLAENFWTSGKK